MTVCKDTSLQRQGTFKAAATMCGMLTNSPVGMAPSMKSVCFNVVFVNMCVGSGGKHGGMHGSTLQALVSILGLPGVEVLNNNHVGMAMGMEVTLNNELMIVIHPSLGFFKTLRSQL